MTLTSLANNWINSITHQKTKSFGVALGILILTGLIMRPSSFCIITSSTPLAIVDLELAFDQQKASMIKQLWEGQACTNIFAFASSGTDAALTNILLDFPFIIAYTSFFIVLIVLFVKSTMLWKMDVRIILIAVALLAAILDIVENIFMVIFLKIGSIPSFLFAIPATVKFGLLLCLIVLLLVSMLVKLVAYLRR